MFLDRLKEKISGNIVLEDDESYQRRYDKTLSDLHFLHDLLKTYKNWRGTLSAQRLLDNHNTQYRDIVDNGIGRKRFFQMPFGVRIPLPQ
jgi:hypothetical protein